MNIVPVSEVAFNFECESDEEVQQMHKKARQLKAGEQLPKKEAQFDFNDVTYLYGTITPAIDKGPVQTFLVSVK